MTSIPLSDDLVQFIQHEAESRGLSIEEFLKSVIGPERMLAGVNKIEREQEWWFSLPLSERAKYQGEYIAVHNQQLVDHDKNKDLLSQRVRNTFGNISVLIMPAEGPQEIHIYSPRWA